MAKQSTRAAARKELQRAQGNLETFASHLQRVYLTHHDKGYEEIDQLLDGVREGTVALSLVLDQLLERI